MNLVLIIYHLESLSIAISMMNNCLRPLFSCLKNSHLHKQFSNKIFSCRPIMSINANQLFFTQNIACKFSSQKPNDTNESLKKQSQQFYQNYVQNIIELQNSKDWPMVVGNTAEPIIIDFYADWCGPCKKLTPILEERVKKTNGKVKLLKVNIDKCGQLAHQLKITSVPTVYAIFRGQGVDSFQGLPEASKIDQMFETIDKIVAISDKQDKAYEYLSNGKKYLSEGKYDQAQKSFLQMSQKGVDEQLIALKQVLLAQCYLSQLKIAKFKDQVVRMKRFEEYYLSNPELKDFYNLIITEEQKISQMSNEIPEITELKNKVMASPNDLTVRFQLSEVYKQNQMMEESLEQLLEIIKLDKTWQNKKANNFMLAIFKELGNASPLTQKYRKLMQRFLN